MVNDVMNTVTQKLEIGGLDLYVHAGWDRNRALRYLDLRLGMGIDSNVRAALELVVIHAKELVDSGTWTLDRMFKVWRGTHLDPSGPCPQVGGIVQSPLDAAARFLEQKEHEFTAARLAGEAAAKTCERGDDGRC